MAVLLWQLFEYYTTCVCAGAQRQAETLGTCISVRSFTFTWVFPCTHVHVFLILCLMCQCAALCMPACRLFPRLPWWGRERGEERVRRGIVGEGRGHVCWSVNKSTVHVACMTYTCTCRCTLVPKAVWKLVNTMSCYSPNPSVDCNTKNVIYF